MLIQRKSMISGEVHSMDLPVTSEQLLKYESGGFLLQDVFPDLTPPQREFIKTGITPDEWEETFGGLEEDDAEPCNDPDAEVNRSSGDDFDWDDEYDFFED